MRTLFTKILLWFLLTVALTSSVTFYVSSVFVRSRQPEFGRFTFELREARTAWETQGKAGLTSFLARLKDATGADAGLADANGRDALTGRRHGSRAVRRDHIVQPVGGFGRGQVIGSQIFVDDSLRVGDRAGA